MTEQQDLSARLARLLGWEPDRAGQCWTGPEQQVSVGVPDLKENWWQVVRAMQERGYSFACWLVPPWSSVMNCPQAAFCYGVHPPARNGNSERVFFGRGNPADDDSIGLAVVAAAVRALESEETAPTAVPVPRSSAPARVPRSRS